MQVAGPALDRAAVAILRQIAEGEPLRSGVPAVRLPVMEASHVTRQLRQLEQGGYVIRVADPDDRRAQRIQVTDLGLAAVERIREVSRRGVGMALAQWSEGDLEHLAALFRRMVGDFLARAEDQLDVPARRLLTRRAVAVKRSPARMVSPSTGIAAQGLPAGTASTSWSSPTIRATPGRYAVTRSCATDVGAVNSCTVRWNSGLPWPT